LPDGFESLDTAGGRAVVRASAKDQLLRLGIQDKRAFEESRKTAPPIGTGRGQAVSASLGPGAGRAVIRHYRRGGLAGRVLDDVYFGGARPVEELRVSEAARRAGVPTPECLAALIWRTGLSYSGDLIVREVPDAVPLDQWLERGCDAASLRKVVGRLADAFASLVAANIYHPDLHAGNVLVQERDPPSLFLIDFDKAEQRADLSPRLRDRMLFRFNRALVKRGLAPRPVGQLTRLRFCKELGIGGDRDEVRRLFSDCGAHLRRHAWRYKK